jgi:hypothetical protein
MGSEEEELKRHGKRKEDIMSHSDIRSNRDAFVEVTQSDTRA